jgi:hypothetical protein
MLMMKNLLALLLLSFNIYSAYSQEIKISKGPFGGVKYTQNEELLTMAELEQAMEVNPEAFRLIKKSRTNNTFATVLSFTGGLLVGFPIGTAIAGGDPEWALAGVGAGLIVVSIPISSKSYKQGMQAVSLYNSTINTTSHFHFKPKFRVIANAYGFGCSMHF